MRVKEQEQRGAVDPNLQAAWNQLDRRSVYLNSLILLAGLCVLGLVHQLQFTLQLTRR